MLNDIITRQESDYEEEDLTVINLKVKAIACGGRHSVVMCSDGSLYTFGFGQQG